jgi:hypothetical protein
MLNKRYFQPKTRFRMAVRRIVDEIKWTKRRLNNNSNNPYNNCTADEIEGIDCNPLNPINLQLFLADKPDLAGEKAYIKMFQWAIFLPARVFFHFTIPDCRLEKYKRFYILTFVLSIFWLAVLSYFIVWMVIYSIVCSFISLFF